MTEKDAKSSANAEIIEEADRLYKAYEPMKLREFLLQHKDSNDDEILWRLCRANRDLAQMDSTSAEDRKNLTIESLDYAKRCLEINDNNFASQKWYAICLSAVCDYVGDKKKVSDAYVMRDHIQKAIDLNPNDAMSRHLMGLWCFTYADMPWYERKIAMTVFGAPITSTYEEAYRHFKKGEEISPSVYIDNLVMLGRTCLKMSNKEEAKEYLEKALIFHCVKDQDKETMKKAKELTQSI